MDIRFFIGIDISKATLDWAVFDGKSVVLQAQSDNSEVGIKATLKVIKALPGFTIAHSICCMEHTGIYNAHALEVLFQVQFPIWLEASLHIKQAGGLQRGKSDRVDAQHIAEYARSGGPVSIPGSSSALAPPTPGDEKIGRINPASSAPARYD